ncbi:MAG: ClpXP protease specificity-enhancing factor SspB [Polyangiaceae bacterium]|nr:ClpXP protease specificity-enhancing factor SspB [Polyangiaceae bacterium]
MPTTTPLPPKKDVALALLENSTVFVHLDPRIDEVRVPAWFKKQPQLVLQIGLNMPVPITDLNLDEESVSCTLSFSRSPFFCFIPWHSVYALVGEDGRGMVWPDDVPPEVTAKTSEAPPPKVAERPRLRAVPASGEPAPAAAELAPAAETAPAKPTRKRTRKKPAIAAAAPPKAKGETPAAPPKAKGKPPAAPPKAKDETPAAPAAAKRAGATDKKKRELPPYLRVVK